MEQTFSNGGGLSAIQIQDAINRSSVKPEEILSNEVNIDTPKKLNRSETKVPIDIINEIETKGMSLERLESLGLPIYKYQTQITVHGNFDGLTKDRVGGYKNLTLNQNKTLGIRYNAIDAEKKKIISKALLLDRKYNEEGAKEGFNTEMDSKGFTVYKRKITTEKSKAIEIANEFKSEANSLPYNFIGNKYVNIYSIYGMYLIKYEIHLNAISQAYLWDFISSITNGRITADSFFKLLKTQEEEENKINLERKALSDERERLNKEKSIELRSQSPYKIINELPKTDEFAVAIVPDLSYSEPEIKVFYIFKNKQNRRVYRIKKYKNWSDVQSNVNKEPTYSEKNNMMGDKELKMLADRVANGGHYLISEVKPVLVIEQKKSTIPDSNKSSDYIYSNDTYEFQETKHTKTNDIIYVLRIKKRLTPIEYKTVESNVKLIRGYYSGYVKGFILKSKLTQNEIERLFDGTSLAKSIDTKDNETLVGGKGDNKTIEDIAAMHNVTVEYAKEQLEKGIEIELEHTNNREKAREIALDHLTEFINYYIELEKMEDKLKSEDSESSSIINKNTDLLGNPKSSWMLTKNQFNQFIEEKNKILQRNYSELKPLFEKYAIIKNGYSIIKDKIEENPILAYYISNKYETGGIGFSDVSYLKRNEIRYENSKYITDNIKDFKTKDEFYKYIKLIWLINPKSNEDYQSTISDALRLSYNGNESIDDSKSKFKRAILNSEMTLNDAILIIESARLEVPNELKKMENKSEQDAEITNNAPFKFEVGDYISIIDEPVSNTQNIYKVIGHQDYNENYGWETTIKNLYTNETVTMFENLLKVSDKNNLIKEITKELTESFKEIDEPTLNLHLKLRLEAIDEQAEFEKVREQYPIVIQWSEGRIGDNIGLNNLDELNDKLKEAGFSNRPTEIYIKNKVFFRGYPHYTMIDTSKMGGGDFDFEKEHVRDWLKKYDKSFDFSIFDDDKKEDISQKSKEIEELEMLIELTQESLNENPNDEDLSLYLEMLKETLSNLKS